MLMPRRPALALGLLTAAAAVATGCSSPTSHPAAARTQVSPPSASAPATSAAAPPQAAATPAARLSVGPSNPGQKPAPRPTKIALRVVKQDGQALVLADLVIHGRPEVFLVDTGASVTLISRTLATALHLPTSTATFPVAGVGGGSTVHAVSISDWRLGGSNLPTSTITTGSQFDNSRIAGLLGSDVLSTFGTITIDYAHQTATLG